MPGGYLELAEVQVPYDCDDGTALETHAHMRWIRILMEAGERIGRPFVEPKLLKEKLEKIGFEDVRVRKDMWPVNPWAEGRRWKVIGIVMLESFNTGLESFSYKQNKKNHKKTKKKNNHLLVEVRKDLNDRSIHLYM